MTSVRDTRQVLGFFPDLNLTLLHHVIEQKYFTISSFYQQRSRHPVRLVWYCILAEKYDHLPVTMFIAFDHKRGMVFWANSTVQGLNKADALSNKYKRGLGLTRTN